MGNSLCYCIKNRSEQEILYTQDKVNNLSDQCNANKKKIQESIVNSAKEKEIIRIQKFVRGFLARRNHKSYDTKITKIQSNESPFEFKTPGKLISSNIPDYSNPETRAAEKRLGPFIYNNPNSLEQNLIDKGPYKLENGAIYIGQWNKKGYRSGKGIQICPDGSKYEGYWENDMHNGKGRLIHADGDAYEGNWINGIAQGYGKYIHFDGSQYEGEWKDDKQHGHGVEIWPDGSKYEGQYEFGKKSGKGCFLWSDKSSYEGDFYMNYLHGKGKYVWNDQKEYIGDWRNNKMEGKGTFIWPDGRRYIGEYKNDLRHGKGEFVWNDGKKYIGDWLKGNQHGIGIYYNNKELNPKQSEWYEGK